MADDDVVLRAAVTSPGAAFRIGCLAGIAIIPAVVLVVNLVTGEDELPDAIRGTTPWFGGAAAVLLALTVVAYVRARQPLRLVRTAEGLALRVGETELARGAMQVLYGYERHKLGRGPAITTLIAGVIVDGRCVASFTEEWGAIYGVPEGWPQGWKRLPSDERTHHYKAAGRRFVANLVRELEAAGG